MVASFWTEYRLELLSFSLSGNKASLYHFPMFQETCHPVNATVKKLRHWLLAVDQG
jgi:hypothetical protein